MGFLRSTVVKNPPANAEDMGEEDPLEEEMATHSSILAWENPMVRQARRATVHGVADGQTRLRTHTHTPHHIGV